MLRLLSDRLIQTGVLRASQSWVCNWAVSQKVSVLSEKDRQTTAGRQIPEQESGGVHGLHYSAGRRPFSAYLKHHRLGRKH